VSNEEEKQLFKGLGVGAEMFCLVTPFSEHYCSDIDTDNTDTILIDL